MRRNTFSRTSRETEALLDHLDELGGTVEIHLRRRSGRKVPFISHRLQHSAPALCDFSPSEPHEHRAGLVHVSGRTPLNLGVELKADASTFEYERHTACLSVKTSTNEPSHVPLRARTLRSAALSS